MKEKIEFTNEEKDKLLIMRGWNKIVGYAMGYEPPESDNVIISLEEIKKCIGKVPETYYFKEEWECTTDLEGAWEYLIDEIIELIAENVENAEGVDEDTAYDYLKNELIVKNGDDEK